MTAAVLRPAAFVLLAADLLLLALALDRQAIAAHTKAHQVVLHRIGAALAEGEVVLVGAPGIGMALDRHPHRGAAADTAARLGRAKPLVIGVTVLTSMDEGTLGSVGVTRPLAEQVVTLARMAQDAGLDGVVASPLETADIRKACGPAFTIVTPGIRGASAGGNLNDQHRTMGPAEAVRAGASYIVVGRPIIAAPDARAAADAIARELGEANLR